MNESKKSVISKVWDIFSMLGGIVGLASMSEGIINWIDFFETIVFFYQQNIRPVIIWIPNLFDWQTWVADYIFVGALFVSSRTRAAFQMMEGHWKIDVSRYKWYHFWAPHQVGSVILQSLMIVIWPIVIIMFLPLKYQSGIHPEDTFQISIYKKQRQWLGVYVLSFIALVIINQIAISIK